MLALMLGQVLFGSVEAGLQSAAALDLDFAVHHDSGNNAGTSALSSDSLPPPAVEVDSESCDHCCQCHGHCSHFAATARQMDTPQNRHASRPPPARSQHTSVFLALPFRPPIA